MVDLKANPYYLSDGDIAWVQSAIAAMSDEEKVGQLFFQLTASQDEDYLRELVQKYHVGGVRYNGMPGAMVLKQNRILQKYAKIPLLIACNPESGGDGACSDGTYVASAIKVGAAGKREYARALGRVSAFQAAAVGCNMAFAPVCDIVYNWACSEVLTRAFGSDPVLVAEMSAAYLEGAGETPGFACAAKHFPGNGQDFRDAHMSNNNNMFGREEWLDTYGHVYKKLIGAGLQSVMGGHIMMPNYMRDIDPSVRLEAILPATLCPEIMTGLLRDELGFNGMVVSDASHMVGMTDRMKRADMLPAAINAGCDMFLFFNDPDEDFNTMLSAYKTGVIGEERMTEALTRILGLKAHLGLHKKSPSELVPPEEKLAAALRNPDIAALAPSISKAALTLVKHKQEGVLPLSPEKTKRIMIAYIKGADSPMTALMAMAMGSGAAKKNPAEMLRDKLIARGFEAFIYESPMDLMKKQLAAGERPSLNLYFAGKFAIEDFRREQDMVITLCDVASGRPAFGFSKGGGEIPWYVHELPVVAVSVNTPTVLGDIPMVKTYINAYDSRPCTIDALVDALMTGPEAFPGRDPIDSFCGLWDAHI